MREEGREKRGREGGREDEERRTRELFYVRFPVAVRVCVKIPGARKRERKK